MNFGGGFNQGNASAPPPPQAGHATDVPKILVQLSVSCTGLADRDFTSKSDPACVLFTQDRQKKWREFDRTEYVKNSLSPTWAKKFLMDYRFEERQLLRFIIFDRDNSARDIDMHDSLGEITCSLGEIVSTQSKGFSKPLHKQKGSLRVVSEEVNGTNELVELSISARGLDNKDTFGKSDPFLQIQRIGGNGSLGSVVHRTETRDNNLNPNWATFNTESRVLCNGDATAPLLFTVYDEERSGDHEVIGSFTTTLQDLKTSAINQYELINEKKKAKKGKKYKNSGTLTINSIRCTELFTFLDFIQSGLQLNFTVAIDFTGSNGHPTNPASLHYMGTSIENEYKQAIRAVGDIIQDYDYDKMFPCLGFGAKIPPSYDVSHEFFVTLDPQSPFCAGVDGIMNAYTRCVPCVQFYGPTNFTPVIEHIKRFATVYVSEPSNYFVLLIITDGIISDMDNTIRSIVGSVGLPLSIIIVGVGDEDFSAMEVLDGDKGGLRADGKVAERDIVQFVRMRDFLSLGTYDKETLSKAVLAEVPGQVLKYMRNNGTKPNTMSARR